MQQIDKRTYEIKSNEYYNAEDVANKLVEEMNLTDTRMAEASIGDSSDREYALMVGSNPSQNNCCSVFDNVYFTISPRGMSKDFKISGNGLTKKLISKLEKDIQKEVKQN